MGGCRRILGLDGCFLKHTCKGQLHTTMGRDANKAAAKCKGRGSKCGDRGVMVAESGGRGQMGAESGGRGQMDVESYGRGGMGSSIRAIGTDSGGRGGRSDGKETMRSLRGKRGGAKRRRGGGRGGRRGGGRGSTSILKQAREEDLMFKRKDLEREREEQQWEAMIDPLNDCRFPDEEESIDVEIVQPTSSVPASDNAAKKKGKRTRSEPDNQCSGQMSVIPCAMGMCRTNANGQ
nr:splicing factor [Tanacetum cinerariifolium]